MTGLSPWVNLGVFLLAAVAIWRAGTRLEQRVDQIARRTGIGQAFAGVVLLATATSLPELATTISAVAIHDNPTLAVHNLLGGVALQTGLLIVTDWTARKRGALTAFAPRYVLLLQGVGVVLLLQVAIAGVAAGGVPAPLSISVWTVLLVAVHLAITYSTHRHRGQPRWTPTLADDYPADGAGADHDAAAADEDGSEPEDDDDDDGAGLSLRQVWLRFAGATAIVIVGGVVASGAADALAEQTGLGSAFVGATLLALATSLPEVSTTISASRHGRYTTAISNIFGSNSFDVALLFVADLLYRDGSVLAGAEPSAIFVATVGAVMTSIYLWGLMEREDRTILRIGWDSAVALVVYVFGMAVLYVAW